MCMANFGSCWPSTQPFICLLLYYYQSDDNLHHFVSVGNHLTYSISSQVKVAFDCLLINHCKSWQKFREIWCRETGK